MFGWGSRTFVVGIVNCSPDSFAGDGHQTVLSAVEHGLRLAGEGADVLDVGGESTRPGAVPVAEEEERRRVLPVVEALVARASIPLSVDTSKAGVAAAALDAGATIVNDVRALLGDATIARVVASRGAMVVLMDNRLAPRTGDPEATGYAPRIFDAAPAGEGQRVGTASGAAIVGAVGDWLAGRVAAAIAAGIARDRIIVDPGLGFGKTPAQSLALLRHLRQLKHHPGLAELPLLVGPSRKGFIGSVLDLPVNERLEGSLAAATLAVSGGADLVRVHDVRAAVRCCRLADAVLRG